MNIKRAKCELIPCISCVSSSCDCAECDPSKNVHPTLLTTKTARWHAAALQYAHTMAQQKVKWIYSAELRLFVALIYLANLPQDERQAILTHQDYWPSKQSVKTTAMNAVWAEVQQCFAGRMAEHGVCGVQPSDRNNLQRRIKDWVRGLVDRQSIHFAPAQKRGEGEQHLFEELRELLLAGYTDEAGQKRLFQGVGHAMKKSTAVAALVAKMQNGRGYVPRTVWKKLKQLYPKMYMALERVKKPRDYVECQRIAKQILGMEDMTVPLYVASAYKRDGVRWHGDRSEKQIFVDTFTIEAAVMLRRAKVISECGLSQPAVEDPLAAKSVGQLPKVSINLAVDADGNVRYFPMVTGSNGGCASGLEGVQFWYDMYLTPDERQEIADRNHCNYTCAVEKALALHTAGQQDWNAGGAFSGSKFLVRYNQVLAHSSSWTAACISRLSHTNPPFAKARSSAFLNAP